jgi:hypothetical protein
LATSFRQDQKIHHEGTKDTKKSTKRDEMRKSILHPCASRFAFLRVLRVFDGQEPECLEGHGWPKEAVANRLILLLIFERQQIPGIA